MDAVHFPVLVAALVVLVMLVVRGLDRLLVVLDRLLDRLLVMLVRKQDRELVMLVRVLVRVLELELDRLRKRMLGNSFQGSLFQKINDQLARSLSEEKLCHYLELQSEWFEALPKWKAHLQCLHFLTWDRFIDWFGMTASKIPLVREYIRFD